MKLVLYGVPVVLAILVLAVYGIGYRLPVKHAVSQQLVLSQSPEKVWEVVADFPSYPQWRTGIVGVVRLPDLDDHPLWHELEKGGGGLKYETLSLEPGKRMVRRIAGEGLPFGGTWTFSLAPHGCGTQLTLVEDGEIYSPIYRFVSRYVLGYQKSMQTYLADLSGRLDQQQACTS